jgi:hypothetical protein
MLTAMFRCPAVVRNARGTPNGPRTLIHLRLHMVPHAVSAEDVAAASDERRIVLVILLHADDTVEHLDSGRFFD